MKRTLKAAAAVLLILVMCMSLTGCIQIDKMREKQGYITKDGTIMLNDTEYLPLPYCEELCPDFFNYYSDDYIDLNVYITAEDVPVLLSSMIGDGCTLSIDKVFISVYFDDLYTETLYCREDKYDEIMEVINNGYEPDGYKYIYGDYNSGDFALDYKERILTDEEVEAINTVLSGATCDEAVGYLGDYEMFAEIYSCMKDQPFERYEFTIYMCSNRYFIELYSECETEDGYYECESDWYKVPEELHGIFDGIMVECKAEYEYYNSDFYYTVF